MTYRTAKAKKHTALQYLAGFAEGKPAITKIEGDTREKGATLQVDDGVVISSAHPGVPYYWIVGTKFHFVKQEDWDLV